MAGSLSQKDFERLINASKDSRQRFNVFREKRSEVVKQVVGEHYAEEGAGDKVPVNLLEMLVQILAWRLVGGDPRGLASTEYTLLKPNAAALEVALARAIKKIKLKEELELAIIDAIYCIGIVKTGVDETTGLPFVSRISLDDFVFDMNAKRRDRVSFVGDRYLVNLEEARNDRRFNAGAREELKAVSPRATDSTGAEKTSEISAGQSGSHESFEEDVELVDFFLPRRGLIVTTAAEDPKKPLRVRKWSGPADGMYEYLGFGIVPDNQMPLAPVMTTRDLHDLVNRLFRKIGRQAERAKTVTVFEKGAERDAKRIMNAGDGEVIGVDRIDSVKEMKYGGPDALLQQAFLLAKDAFMMQSGGLELMGGLGPASGTARQDEMLNANAGQQIDAMANRVNTFAGNVMHKMAWYLWADPETTHRLTRYAGRSKIPFHVEWGPMDRLGDFDDYGIEIDPYSLRPRTPDGILRSVYTLWEKFITPAAGAMAAQGITVDFRGFLKLIARLEGIEAELGDFLFMGSRGGGRAASEQQGMPANTSRTYEHVSPGATRRGNEQVLQQILAGAGKQDSQAAALQTA